MNHLLLFIVGLLAYCLPANEEQAAATLVLYRKKELMGTAFDLSINGQTLSQSIVPNRYFVVEVPAGPLQIQSSAWNATTRVLKLQVEAGKKYYIKGQEEVDFLQKYLRLILVEPEKAQLEMKKCKGLVLTLPKKD
jgi:hypothetical protein